MGVAGWPGNGGVAGVGHDPKNVVLPPSGAVIVGFSTVTGVASAAVPLALKT